jgi:PHP family Zn ribbon phosphoesterase
MNILHRVPAEELASVVGESIARDIVRARSGILSLVTGGGGKYGRVVGGERAQN